MLAALPSQNIKIGSFSTRTIYDLHAPVVCNVFISNNSFVGVVVQQTVKRNFEICILVNLERKKHEKVQSEKGLPHQTLSSLVVFVVFVVRPPVVSQTLLVIESN